MKPFYWNTWLTRSKTKLREADRSIGDDIPNQYREGWMDAFGWAATYCRLLAERK